MPWHDATPTRERGEGGARATFGRSIVWSGMRRDTRTEKIHRASGEVAWRRLRSRIDVSSQLPGKSTRHVRTYTLDYN